MQQLVDELIRRFDPGGYQLQCPLSGCGWHLYAPRLELDPEPLSISPDGDHYVINAEGVPREDVELVLRIYVDLHAALTETGVAGVPDGRPPRWEDAEP